MSFTDIFSNIASGFTIAGVISAWIIYHLWEKNFLRQKRHEYASDLLASAKKLHFYIEALRLEKNSIPRELYDNLDKHFIPLIQEKIIQPFLDIGYRIEAGDHLFINSTALLETCNNEINKKIIAKINNAVNLFYFRIPTEDRNNQDEIKDCGLFKIIYPNSTKHQQAYFLLNQNIIKDDFNQQINDSFNELYDRIKENLVNSKKQYIKNILKVLIQPCQTCPRRNNQHKK